MKRKILYISESFSQQPHTLRVGWEYENGVLIASIEEDVIGGANSEPIDVYRGYDEKRNVLFDYIRSSVNVGYS